MLGDSGSETGIEFRITLTDVPDGKDDKVTWSGEGGAAKLISLRRLRPTLTRTSSAR